MYCYHCMTKLEDGAQRCFCCGRSTEPELIPHHLRQGTVLNGKYLIGDAIGEGGFGITYIGMDLSLELRIAVKEFYPGGYAARNSEIDNRVTLNYRDQGEYFRRGKELFLREARNIAKFSKEDGVVDVRDYFTENETAYIVMEYLDGITLAKYLRDSGRMEAREIASMLLPVMRSLEKMHTKGIIHRDISPDNIMLLKDRSVCLTDFGSSRYFTDEDKKTMSVVLKPGYAPYEQYSSQGDQGPWTDVYGLCATMYKCITGRTPVDSLTRCKGDTLKKPSETGASISPSLEAVLMYGLAVFPEHRCRSMRELIGMVEKALDNDFAVQSFPTDDRRYDTVAAEDPDAVTVRPYRSYGDSRAYGGYSAPPPAASGHYPPPAPAPKKSYTGVIVVCIIASMLIIGGLITFFMFKGLESMDSSPDTKVVITDVSGKKLSDAAAELESLGLVVETREEESADVAEGYVLRQSVEPGRELNNGDTVMLYVAGSGDTEQSGDGASSASSNTVSKAVLYNTLCKEYVTLRSETSMKAPEITRIPKGASVKLEAYVQDSEFIKVSYDGRTGYALAAFFTEEDTADGRYVMYCCARQYANLRSRPGSYNEYNITTIPTDSPVQCTGSYEYVGDQKYLEVRYKTYTGYVLEDVFNRNMVGSTYKGN